MSYWNQNSVSSSQIDDVLAQENVTLQEVIEEAEVLQECKSQNKKLVDFLSRVDILRELINLTTRVPPDDIDMAVRYKHASIACELLTSEIHQIIQKLASEQFLLDEIYAFLETDEPLNPLLASYFSRIMGVLISKPSEQNWFSYQVTCLHVLEFLKSKGNFVPLLVRHIGTSAIMDLILKMYTKIEGEEIRDDFLSWLDDCEFLEQLIGQLNGETTTDVRANVCQLLCDLVLQNRENINKDKSEEDRIFKKIESEEFVKRLLGQMLLEPRCEGSIVGGISVLLTLLGNEKKGEQLYSTWEKPPSPGAAIVAENTLSALIPYLANFVDIMHNPPTKLAVRTTVGVLDPPLGATRVEIARLLAALVATGQEAIHNELQRQDLLNILLNLFFRYPWNNFFHTQVEATLVAAFKSTTLVTHILLQCKLLQRILEAWRDNEENENDKKPRRGYMGHVIRISNLIVAETAKSPLKDIFEQVDETVLEQWKEFLSTGLAKVNGDQASGVAFKQLTQENENENEAFYQEELTPTFHENFFREQPEANDNDGDGVSGRDLKPGFPSGDNERTLAQQEELFNKVCEAKLGGNIDTDNWPGLGPNKVWEENSSDEELTASGDEEDEWLQMALASPVTAPIGQSDPWSADVLTASSPPEQGWANFESSPFLANFGYELSSTIATSASDDMDRVPFDLTPTEASSSIPFPDGSDLNENLTDKCEIMETAQVVTSENAAEIITASDYLMNSRPNASLTISSSLPSSNNSNVKPLEAALTPETVIKQTDDDNTKEPASSSTTTMPLDNPSDDVDKQLSDLLAQVSCSDNRTLCNAPNDNNDDQVTTNGPPDALSEDTRDDNTQNNTSLPIYSLNESSKQVSTPDNDAPQENDEIVPNVPTSTTLAVNEGSCDP